VAWLLATHPDDAMRDGRQALQLAQEACRQTNQQQPEMLRSLAAAQAENRQFAQAEQTAQRAEPLARQAGNEKLAERLQADLETFRRGEPLREHPVFPFRPLGKP
jgi:hypothetical protein